MNVILVSSTVLAQSNKLLFVRLLNHNLFNGALRWPFLLINLNKIIKQSKHALRHFYKYGQLLILNVTPPKPSVFC